MATATSVQRKRLPDLIIEFAGLLGVGLEPEYIDNKKFLNQFGITGIHRFLWLPSLRTFSEQDIANIFQGCSPQLDSKRGIAQVAEVLRTKFYTNYTDYYYFEEIGSRSPGEKRYKLYCYTPDP